MKRKARNTYRRSKGVALTLVILSAAVPLLLSQRGVACASNDQPKSGYVGRNGSAHIPSESIPLSRFMSSQAKQTFTKLFAGSSSAPPINGPIGPLRAYFHKFNVALLAQDKARYSVTTTRETIGGVPTVIVFPKGGVSARNRYRILINLHGGGFLWGAQDAGEVESIPISAEGKIEVVAVVYRQGPEYKFPAASEDVTAVYRELLKKYPAKNIGIYGCSAGGILTAESIAWFEKLKLALPGAIGTFCGSASPLGGDSAYVAPGLTAQPPLPGSKTGRLSFTPYFSDVSLSNPLVFPTESKLILSKFPPTLLITGSRDFTMSSMFHTQEALTAVGVNADLHVWDGMWHAFFIDPDLPESRQMYHVVVSFFDHHLGLQPRLNPSPPAPVKRGH